MDIKNIIRPCQNTLYFVETKRKSRSFGIGTQRRPHCRGNLGYHQPMPYSEWWGNLTCWKNYTGGYEVCVERLQQ